MSETTVEPKGHPSGKTAFLPGVMLFLRQVIGELKKVVTPTRKELVRYTLVVLVFVVVMIIIASILDFAFGAGAMWLFGGGTGDN
jgi:preprotein translocase subunit SecE